MVDQPPYGTLDPLTRRASSSVTTMTPRPLLRSCAKAALVLCLVATAGLALGSERAAASSSSACWQRVLHDWFVDGRIDGTYPPKCLNQAMAHLGPDAQQYSSFSDEAHRALQADERWLREHPKRKPHYNMSPLGGPSGGDNGPPSLHPGGHPSASGPPLTNLFDKGQPSDPTSIPVPLLVLGGVGVLLLLAAAGSFAARRIQARRLQASPAAAPHAPERP